MLTCNGTEQPCLRAKARAVAVTAHEVRSDVGLQRHQATLLGHPSRVAYEEKQADCCCNTPWLVPLQSCKGSKAGLYTHEAGLLGCQSRGVSHPTRPCVPIYNRRDPGRHPTAREPRRPSLAAGASTGGLGLANDILRPLGGEKAVVPRTLSAHGGLHTRVNEQPAKIKPGTPTMSEHPVLFPPEQLFVYGT